MEEDFDEVTMDACLIAAGRRAEHYEMAAYGTLLAGVPRPAGEEEVDFDKHEPLARVERAPEVMPLTCRWFHADGVCRHGAAHRAAVVRLRRRT
jgi:hypothetical protein